MNKQIRRIFLSALFFLPVEKRAFVSRWLRGRQEYKKLQKADIVFVTCPKSGRTWLRIMLSRILQQRLRLPGTSIIGTSSFHRQHPNQPIIFFTHDTNLGYYTGNKQTKQDYIGKKVVILVRDPRDVVVSAYFQWLHRMDSQKRALHTFTMEGKDLSAFEFAMHPDGALTKVMEMLNSWDAALKVLNDVLVVHYEDLRNDPANWLNRIAQFIDLSPTPPEINDAVAYGSLENMKKLERSNSFGTESRRFSTGRQESNEAHKVRRGKVGGYYDYFNDEEICSINDFVNSKLAKRYGYQSENE